MKDISERRFNVSDEGDEESSRKSYFVGDPTIEGRRPNLSRESRVVVLSALEAGGSSVRYLGSGRIL